MVWLAPRKNGSDTIVTGSIYPVFTFLTNHTRTQTPQIEIKKYREVDRDTERLMRYRKRLRSRKRDLER